MITITDNAVNELKRIMAQNINYTNYIRVSVIGGGCSGMSYNLDFETQPATLNDGVFGRDDVFILIDKKSLLYLSGTELDFSGGLNGTGFTFNNPNAKRTCGCGSSFST